MHDDQAARLKHLVSLYKEDTEEMDAARWRLMAAAAYLTNAGTDLPDGDPMKYDLMMLEYWGSQFAQEQAMLNIDGLFEKRYSPVTFGGDYWIQLQHPDLVEQTLSRNHMYVYYTEAGAQMVAGAAGVVGGGAMVVGGVKAGATGVGMVIAPEMVGGGIYIMAASKDYMNAGMDKLNSVYESTLGYGIMYSLATGEKGGESLTASAVTSLATEALMYFGSKYVTNKIIGTSSSSQSNTATTSTTNTQLVTPGRTPQQIQQAERLARLKAEGRVGNRYTGDQQALLQLGKEAEAAGGATRTDAHTLKNWADEYGVPARVDNAHGGQINFDHLNLRKQHIPIVD
jgi:hypothetical protein